MTQPLLNYVTYAVALTPENAEKIDLINRILVGDYNTTAPDAKPSSKSEPAPKPSSKPESEPQPEPKTSAYPSAESLKTAAKKVKADHGEEFALAVISENGIEVNSTLGRTINKVPEESRQEIMDAWANGPMASDIPEDLDEDLDDDDDDGLDEADVDPEAVKTALKAMSKRDGRDAAKALMKEHKINALSEITDETKPEALAALLKGAL